jgi:hypothetical protein
MKYKKCLVKSSMKRENLNFLLPHIRYYPYHVLYLIRRSVTHTHFNTYMLFMVVKLYERIYSSLNRNI